jgi:hypothetical protein
LLKKDKPVKELQQCMAEQLDVFLGVETEPFVERLFEVIKSEEYKTAADNLPASDLVETDLTKIAQMDHSGVAIAIAELQSTAKSTMALKSIKECTPPIFDVSLTNDYVLTVS